MVKFYRNNDSSGELYEGTNTDIGELFLMHPEVVRIRIAVFPVSGPGFRCIDFHRREYFKVDN